MTNTYDTSMYPLGSTHPKVLFNNASNLDDGAMNDRTLTTWVDRFGAVRKSWFGIETDAANALIATGFEFIGDYDAVGELTFTRQNQVMSKAGEYWRPAASLTLPYTTVNNWVTDQPKFVSVGDAALRSQLAAANGDASVGSTTSAGWVTTVGTRLDLIDNGTLYADDPRFAGDIVAAAAAMGDNTVLVIRQPYTLTAPLRVVGKTNPVVVCVGAGKLNGSRSSFTFPTANARGILHFDNCINPIAYRVNVLGARASRASDPLQDGDAGIEFYQCTSPKTIECKVDQVMTWGVIHIQCTDTQVIDCKLTNMTRQSGIGHATVDRALCRGNYISYSGLYGIEIEGVNTDVEISENKVYNCLKGIAVIASANSVAIKNNIVALCTYLIQLDTNGAGNNQVGVEVTGNRTYDGVFHYFLNDTTFTDITGNTALGRVSNAFIPQRQSDQVVSVISDTTVLILDSTSGTILPGDIHFYSEGVFRTVASVTTSADATYGPCWRVVYTVPDATIAFGSFFLRSVSFVGGSTAWMYMSGTRNSNVNVANNSVNAPLGRGLDLNGNMNALRWGQNRMVGVAVGYYAGDATPITNSSIMCKRGDIQQPGTSMVSGASPQKLFPSMVGEVRTVTMGAPNKPINMATNGTSTAFRLRVNVYGSTKTGSTGDAAIFINGATVATIPVATIGTTLIQLDISVSVAASSFTVNIADTFGDMTFSSASFELHTVEV